MLLSAIAEQGTAASSRLLSVNLRNYMTNKSREEKPNKSPAPGVEQLHVAGDQMTSLTLLFGEGPSNSCGVLTQHEFVVLPYSKEV